MALPHPVPWHEKGPELWDQSFGICTKCPKKLALSFPPAWLIGNSESTLSGITENKGIVLAHVNLWIEIHKRYHSAGASPGSKQWVMSKFPGKKEDLLILFSDGISLTLLLRLHCIQTVRNQDIHIMIISVDGCGSIAFGILLSAQTQMYLGKTLMVFGKHDVY